MKRFYKIVIFFILVLLLGVFVFAKYIDYSLDKKDELRSVEQLKESEYRFNNHLNS